MGKLEESKRTTQKAIDLSQRDPMLWAFTVLHSLTCVLNRENEEGLSWALQTLQIPKENVPIKDENGFEPYLTGMRRAGLAES